MPIMNLSCGVWLPTSLKRCSEWLGFDCNNFYVSCERLFKPMLEGRAVVVMSGNDGCVVARSNEAKALGVKMRRKMMYQIASLVRQHNVVAISETSNCMVISRNE